MSERKWEVGPVKLVEGGDATIYQYCEKRRRYIGAWHAATGAVYAAEWDVDGSYLKSGVRQPTLNLVPPPKKTMRFKRYVCFYPDGDWTSHSIEEEARAAACDDLFAMFVIDREVTEGEGLSETPN